MFLWICSLIVSLLSLQPSLCTTTEVQQTVEVTTAECAVLAQVPSLGEVVPSGYRNTEVRGHLAVCNPSFSLGTSQSVSPVWIPLCLSGDCFR